jgi:urate oxidase
MAVFDATKQEANEFYDKYDKICSGILEYTMYQWDAMPILSLLSSNV